jgi:hypothetical protein
MGCNHKKAKNVLRLQNGPNTTFQAGQLPDIILKEAHTYLQRRNGIAVGTNE